MLLFKLIEGTLGDPKYDSKLGRSWSRGLGEIGAQSSSMKEADAYHPRMGVLEPCIGQS